MILNTFKEGRDLLRAWQDRTTEMYPSQPDALDIIIQSSELDIGKMHRGSIMTDTCDKAHKQCHLLLAAAIKEAAKNCKVPESEI